MNSILKFILTVIKALCILGITSSANGQRQEVIKVKSLSIDIMPEFDRKGLLITYKGVLDPSTSLPAYVSLNLPSNFEINAVAYRDFEKRSLLLTKYEVKRSGDISRITITSQADNFWLEFYTLPEMIKKEKEIKTFKYTWGGDFEVESFMWRVQRPATASDLRVEPDGGVIAKDEYGMSTYQLTLGNQQMGANPTINVSYKKKDDVITVATLQQTAAVHSNSATLQDNTNMQGSAVEKKQDYFPITIIILVLGFLVMIVIIYWPKNKK